MHVSLTTALLFAAAASAQVYGTGALGALSPTANVTLSTNANGGVFNYTTINIPAGVTVQLVGAIPAILLCQGSVTIAGTLSASSPDQTVASAPPTPGGPGGWAGGGWMQDGLGPGGGHAGGMGFGVPPGAASHATSGGYAPTYGTALPFDLRGGSGGGGAPFHSFSIPPANATGGGGTVVLLAGGAIQISGAILARGGTIAVPYNPFYPVTYGAPGSGGSILIRSLQSVQVSGSLDARSGSLSPTAGLGFIRIDSWSSSGAPDLTGSTIVPAPLVAPLPYLTALAAARIGHVYPIRCASAPGDDVTLYVSLGTASIPIPPFGVVALDPTMLWSFGNHAVPATGHDPLAQIDIPIPNEPWLIGITFYAQAINNLGSVAGLPRLSNLLPIPIGP